MIMLSFLLFQISCGGILMLKDTEPHLPEDLIEPLKGQ